MKSSLYARFGSASRASPVPSSQGTSGTSASPSTPSATNQEHKTPSTTVSTPGQGTGATGTTSQVSRQSVGSLYKSASTPPSTVAASGATDQPGLSRSEDAAGALSLDKARMNPTCVVISRLQRTNVILRHLSHVTTETHDILPDFELGAEACAIFLTLSYHQRDPKFIRSRMNQIKDAYRLRVLLVLIDQDDNHIPLCTLGVLCYHLSWTMICAWSPQEAARYLELLRLNQSKSADSIKERLDTSTASTAYATFAAALQTIQKIDRRDIPTLLSKFGSFAALADATKQQLLECEHFGETKAKRLLEVFHQPFFTSKKKGKRKSTGAETTAPTTSAEDTSLGASNSSSISHEDSTTG